LQARTCDFSRFHGGDPGSGGTNRSGGGPSGRGFGRGQFSGILRGLNVVGKRFSFRTTGRHRGRSRFAADLAWRESGPLKEKPRPGGGPHGRKGAVSAKHGPAGAFEKGNKTQRRDFGGRGGDATGRPPTGREADGGPVGPGGKARAVGAHSGKIGPTRAHDKRQGTGGGDQTEGAPAAVFCGPSGGAGPAGRGTSKGAWGPNQGRSGDAGGGKTLFLATTPFSGPSQIRGGPPMSGTGPAVGGAFDRGQPRSHLPTRIHPGGAIGHRPEALDLGRGPPPWAPISVAGRSLPPQPLPALRRSRGGPAQGKTGKKIGGELEGGGVKGGPLPRFFPTKGGARRGLRSGDFLPPGPTKQGRKTHEFQGLGEVQGGGSGLATGKIMSFHPLPKLPPKGGSSRNFAGLLDTERRAGGGHLPTHQGSERKWGQVILTGGGDQGLAISRSMFHPCSAGASRASCRAISCWIFQRGFSTAYADEGGGISRALRVRGGGRLFFRGGGGSGPARRAGPQGKGGCPAGGGKKINRGYGVGVTTAKKNRAP